MQFEQAVEGIFRLKVPFESVYTSVFLIKASDCNILVDSATTRTDVKEIIIPALSDLGVAITDIKYLVLTHEHEDHAGGSEWIYRANRNIEIVRDIQDISKDIEIISMVGHSSECIGILDLRTGTLISGDGLQGDGIGRYRCSVVDLVGYVKTINKVKADKRVQNVLFSHAYEPWYSDTALGREEVEKRLDDCMKSLSKR